MHLAYAAAGVRLHWDAIPRSQKLAHLSCESLAGGYAKVTACIIAG